MVENVPRGGGRSTPIERRSVARKTASSVVGKRCGSTRSVNDAIPTRNSPSEPRKRRAALTARSYRIGAPGRRRRQHRAGRVDDDEHLASGRTSRSDVHSDPRLRGGEPEQPACDDESRDRKSAHEARRLRQVDRPARRRRRAAARAERGERHQDAERERRAERGEQSHVHARSPSSRCRARRLRRRASRDRPPGASFPPAASVGRIPAPRWRSASRLNFASALSGSNSIACRKLATAFSSSSLRSGAPPPPAP